jgi:hypothetical protein
MTKHRRIRSLAGFRQTHAALRASRHDLVPTWSDQHLPVIAVVHVWRHSDEREGPGRGRVSFGRVRSEIGGASGRPGRIAARGRRPQFDDREPERHGSSSRRMPAIVDRATRCPTFFNALGSACSPSSDCRSPCGSRDAGFRVVRQVGRDAAGRTSHFRVTNARCHRRIVSGVTSSANSCGVGGGVPAPRDAGADDRPVGAGGCPVAPSSRGLLAKVGDHIALLTIEPPKQRRQQHLQRYHASTLTPARARPDFQTVRAGQCIKRRPRQLGASQCRWHRVTTSGVPDVQWQ